MKTTSQFPAPIYFITNITSLLLQHIIPCRGTARITRVLLHFFSPLQLCQMKAMNYFSTGILEHWHAKVSSGDAVSSFKWELCFCSVVTHCARSLLVTAPQPQSTQSTCSTSSGGGGPTTAHQLSKWLGQNWTFLHQRGQLNNWVQHRQSCQPTLSHLKTRATLCLV